MLGTQKRWQEELFVAGPLSSLIPDDHILKRVDMVLDLSWLRDEVKDLSRQDGFTKAVTGRYRKLMQNNFPKSLYGQRWQIETVFSMLKRNLGSALRARYHHSQTREIRLRVLTHNLMILRHITYVLYRAGQSPIFSYYFLFFGSSYRQRSNTATNHFFQFTHKTITT